jgi:hypothetical protein
MIICPFYIKWSNIGSSFLWTKKQKEEQKKNLNLSAYLNQEYKNHKNGKLKYWYLYSFELNCIVKNLVKIIQDNGNSKKVIITWLE